MAPPSPARVLRRCLAVGLVATGVALLPTSPSALADPTVPANASQAEQELARISHQAEALNEQVLAAQDDLTVKRGAERTAQDQVGAARTALEQARATQAQFQGTVDTLAAASYEGARVNQLSALMLSKSPQELLDQMSGLDVLATDTRARVSAYTTATATATQAQGQAGAAARVATDAATAAQRAQDEVTTKQGDLDHQAGVIRAKLAALTAAQRSSYLGSPVPAGFSAPTASPAATATTGTTNAPATTTGTTGTTAAPAVTPAAGTATAPAVTPAAGTATAPAVTPAAGTTAAPAVTPAAGTATAPSVTTGSSAPPYVAPAGSGVGAAALQAALSKVGSPYSYGANGPSTFDCSGLVQWSYGQAGMSLPRTTGGQSGVGSAVSVADLQPGDIVLFYDGGHDGLYAGNGMVVHAPTEGDVVKVAPMQYMLFSGARRV